MDEIFSIREEFESEINNFWNNPKFSEIEIIKRGYGIHDKIIKNSILFIGINPSFTKNAIHGNYFINLDQEAKASKEGKPYVYFKKFVDITNKLNNNQEIKRKIKWSHLDLLFHRETKQHFIDNLKKEKNGFEFISEQLELSKKFILKSRPKVIVVSNTKARNFLKGYSDKISMGFEFKFDEDLGTDIIINHPDLNNVPIFFTSMLSGQRALDNGSYDRLIWHIDYVLKKTANKVS